MFSWILPNIHPEYRSSQNCVQVYLIVKTAYLKKSGALDKFLHSFSSDVLTLQTSGIAIDVNGEMKSYKESLIFSAGDPSASAMLGVFKGSVTAYRPCRTCTTINDQWKTIFREIAFHLRSKIEHEDDLAVITDESLSKGTRGYWKRMYGVNNQSPLMQIIDVPVCLPHDTMHLVKRNCSHHRLIRFTLANTLPFFIRKRTISCDEALEHIECFFASNNEYVWHLKFMVKVLIIWSE